jgi:hypothetical protein
MKNPLTPDGIEQATFRYRFIPENYPEIIAQDTGRAGGPCLTDAGNLAVTGIRSPSRQTLNESL